MEIWTYFLEFLNAEYKLRVCLLDADPAFPFRYSDMECVKLVKQKISFISEIGAYMICIVNFQNVLYIFFFLLSFDTFCVRTNNKRQTHSLFRKKQPSCLYSIIKYTFSTYYNLDIIVSVVYSYTSLYILVLYFYPVSSLVWKWVSDQ